MNDEKAALYLQQGFEAARQAQWSTVDEHLQRVYGCLPKKPNLLIR